MDGHCKSCNDTGYQVNKATGMLIYFPGLAGGYFPCGACDKGKEAMEEHQRLLRLSWPLWKQLAFSLKRRWHRAAKGKHQ